MPCVLPLGTLLGAFRFTVLPRKLQLYYLVRILLLTLGNVIVYKTEYSPLVTA